MSMISGHFKNKLHNVNLLLIGPYPPPFGGIASHLVTLIPGLCKRNIGSVAVIKFEAEDKVQVVNGISIYSFREKKHTWKLLLPVNWKFFLVSLFCTPIKQLGIKSVLREATKGYLIGKVSEKYGSNVFSYYQVDHSLSIMICSRLWRRSKAFVLTVFGEVYDEVTFFKRAQSMVSNILNSADRLASSSCHCANGYINFLSKRSIEPVYYGVDLERFSTAGKERNAHFRTQHQIKDTDVLLLFMGRFSPLMGLDQLLKIIPEIVEKNENAFFVIAGANGPLSEEVDTLKSRFPSKVKVLKDVPFDMQPELYQSADIVLAPSRDRHACMGMSIKEAMASSKPVIGAEAGGIPEAIIPGETGYLVPLDGTQNVDVEKLKTAITELINQPSKRITMGNNARVRAEQMFSMDRTIDRMADIFLSALEEKITQK